MERRKHKRAPLAVPIRIRIDDIERFALQHSYDLSTGGIFFQTDRPYSVGTKVELQFYLRAQRKKIPAKGVVVRTVGGEDRRDGQAGIAIEFTELSEAAFRFVEMAIEKWNLHHPSSILELPDHFFEEVDGEVLPATERGLRPPSL